MPVNERTRCCPNCGYELPAVPDPAGRRLAGKRKTPFFKRLLRVLLCLFAGIGLAVTVRFAIEQLKPDDRIDYSVQALCAWADESWKSGRLLASATFRCKDGEDLAAVQTALEEHLDSLEKSDLEFWYRVTAWHSIYTEDNRGVTVDLSLTYRLVNIPYEAVPYAATPQEIAEKCVEMFREGYVAAVVKTPCALTADDISELGWIIGENDVSTAAEWSYFEWDYPKDLQSAEKILLVTKFYYEDGEALDGYSEEMNAALDEMAENIRRQQPGGEKEWYRAVGDAVVQAAEYDDDIMNGGYTDSLNERDRINRSAYGVAVSGKTVCSGYAFAFKALCDRLELPCWVVSGYLNGGGHAWNVIRADGADYHCDCTAVDTGGNSSYFFLSEERVEALGYQYSKKLFDPFTMLN